MATIGSLIVKLGLDTGGFAHGAAQSAGDIANIGDAAARASAPLGILSGATATATVAFQQAESAADGYFKKLAGIGTAVAGALAAAFTSKTALDAFANSRLPGAREFTKDIAKTEKALTRLAAAVGEYLAPSVMWVNKLIRSIADPLTDFIRKFTAFSRSASEFLRVLGNNFVAAFGAVMPMLTGIVNRIRGLFAGPAHNWMADIDAFRKWWNATWYAILTYTAPIMVATAEAIDGALGMIEDVARSAFQALSDGAAMAADWLGFKIPEGAGQAGTALQSLGAIIQQGVIIALQAATFAFQNWRLVAQAAWLAIQVGGEMALAAIKSAWATAVAWVSSLVARIPGYFATAWAASVAYTTAAGAAIGSYLGEVFASLGQYFSELAGQVSEALAPVVEWLAGAFETLAAGAEATFNAIWGVVETVASAIGSAFSAVASMVGSSWETAGAIVLDVFVGIGVAVGGVVAAFAAIGALAMSTFSFFEKWGSVILRIGEDLAIGLAVITAISVAYYAWPLVVMIAIGEALRLIWSLLKLLWAGVKLVGDGFVWLGGVVMTPLNWIAEKLNKIPGLVPAIIAPFKALASVLAGVLEAITWIHDKIFGITEKVAELKDDSKWTPVTADDIPAAADWGDNTPPSLGPDGSSAAGPGRRAPHLEMPAFPWSSFNVPDEILHPGGGAAGVAKDNTLLSSLTDSLKGLVQKFTGDASPGTLSQKVQGFIDRVVKGLPSVNATVEPERAAPAYHPSSSPKALLADSAELALAANRASSPINEQTKIQRQQLAVQQQHKKVADQQLAAAKANASKPEHVVNF
jgi:hypothetical protein